MGKDEWLMAGGAKVRLKNSPEIREYLPGAMGMDTISQISYWDKYAVDKKEGYEADTLVFKWVAPTEMARMLLPHLQKGQEVLDIGCGSGLVKEAFSSHDLTKDLVFDGVDFSANMLEKAKQRGYRNLVCVNLSQKEVARAVWDDLGNEKKYSALVSVGVYGDFISQFNLPFIFDLVDEHAVVAVAGREDNLCLVPSILKAKGFEVVHQEKGVAHYVYSDNQDTGNFFSFSFNPRSLPNPKFDEVVYSYFIGKR